jgi:tRNA(Ile2) C34 agmatinyltransferase TiaS
MDVHQQHLDDMVRRQGLPVHDIVTDLSAEQTQCPACLTMFATEGRTRCPDCGLNFGG